MAPPHEVGSGMAGASAFLAGKVLHDRTFPAKNERYRHRNRVDRTWRVKGAGPSR
jgi:hypothetical protein